MNNIVMGFAKIMWKITHNKKWLHIYLDMMNKQIRKEIKHSI